VLKIEVKFLVKYLKGRPLFDSDKKEKKNISGFLSF